MGGIFIFLLQGVNPWIEVDGGVGPANAYKVCDLGDKNKVYYVLSKSDRLKFNFQNDV